jgi:hypothetical protein
VSAFEQVVAALRRGAADQALAAIPDAALQAGDDPRLQGRILAWHAQALALQGQHRPALDSLREAIRLAKAHEPQEQVVALRRLQGDWLMALQTPPVEGQTAADTSTLGRALAAIKAGDTTLGEALADQAFADAQDAKEQVVALLALANLPHRAAEAIAAAAQIADDAGDMNLVTAVVRGARQAGVDLEVHVY